MALRLLHLPTPISDTSLDAFASWCTSEGLAKRSVAAYSSDVRALGIEGATQGEHERVALDLGADRLLAPRTRARRLASASRYYDFLASVDPAYSANPYRGARRPRMGVVLPAVVTTPEQARAMIATAKPLPGAVIALMAGAGLRVAEVASLALGDLDIDRQVVHVVDGKGGKSRDVPLSSAVVAALLRAAEAGAWTRCEPEDRAFDVSIRTLQNWVARAAAAAGLDGVHPHALRHGFATAVYRSEKDLLLTGNLLGHSSVTTTQIYTHIADDRRTEAVEVAL